MRRWLWEAQPQRVKRLIGLVPAALGGGHERIDLGGNKVFSVVYLHAIIAHLEAGKQRFLGAQSFGPRQGGDEGVR